MSRANILANFHLIFESDLDEYEFNETFSLDNIIDSKIQIVLPDGNVVNTKYSVLEKWELIDFKENKKSR